VAQSKALKDTQSADPNQWLGLFLIGFFLTGFLVDKSFTKVLTKIPVLSSNAIL